MKWPGDHTYTDARRDITQKDQCYAPIATNRSPTHTSWEDANITPKSARQDTTARSNSFKTNWTNTMKGIWPIVSTDLGNKTIKGFKTQTQIQMIAPQADPNLHALETTQKGLKDNKMKTHHPTIILTDLLLNTKDHNTKHQISSKL